MAAQLLGRVKVTDVTDMQEIEASIGERYFSFRAPPGVDLLAQLLSTENFSGWRVQWDLVAGGDFSSALSNSCRETVAVPRFITTIPPA